MSTTLIDPRAHLRQLYCGVDGYVIPSSDKKRIRQSKGAETYGELTPTGVLRLLEAVNLGEKDVFYDLGAGSGKVVVGAAIATPARKCVGVELSTMRIRLAKSVLKKVRGQNLLRAQACGFREQDLLTTYLADATVIYTCSTAFSARFLDRIGKRLSALGRQLTVVTLQDFDRIPAHSTLAGTVTLPTTWARRVSASIYQFRRRS